METEHEVPGQVCPSCQYAMDRSTGVGTESAPEPGDVTLCIKCGEILLFDTGLRLRLPEPVELYDLQFSAAWPKIQKVQAAIAHVHRKATA